MEKLYFARDDGKSVVIEFTDEESLLFAGPELKFIHYLRNQQLGVAYSLGGLFAEDYEFIAEFTNLSSIIISNKKYTMDEVRKIDRDGITNESLSTLRDRYQELLFYGRLDPDIKTTQLYGHKNENVYDGFILDNGCFSSLAQGKVQLNSNIKLNNPNKVAGGKPNNDQLVNLLLPLPYSEIVNKCKSDQYSKVCNEEFWQRYAQQKKYSKTKNTWKESVEYEEITKPSLGGNYDKNKGLFTFITPYTIDDNIKLTKGEKEKLAQQLELELIDIPEVESSKNLRFKFGDNFEFSFTIDRLNNTKKDQISEDISDILTTREWQLKRGNNLYNIEFE